jgi:hypothetical protein
LSFYPTFLDDKDCRDYVPEKDNPYPLCDRSNCILALSCNQSAHMLGPYDGDIIAMSFPDGDD